MNIGCHQNPSLHSPLPQHWSVSILGIAARALSSASAHHSAHNVSNTVRDTFGEAINANLGLLMSVCFSSLSIFGSHCIGPLNWMGSKWLEFWQKLDPYNSKTYADKISSIRPTIQKLQSFLLQSFGLIFGNKIPKNLLNLIELFFPHRVSSHLKHFSNLTSNANVANLKYSVFCCC